MSSPALSKRYGSPTERTVSRKRGGPVNITTFSVTFKDLFLPRHVQIPIPHFINNYFQLQNYKMLPKAFCKMSKFQNLFLSCHFTTFL